MSAVLFRREEAVTPELLAVKMAAALATMSGYGCAVDRVEACEMEEDYHASTGGNA